MVYYIQKIFYKGDTIMWFQKKKTNYGKIIAVTVAVVAGASAIAFVIYKLIKKYTADLVLDCDDFLDECDECDLAIDDADDCEGCEEVVADAE